MVRYLSGAIVGVWRELFGLLGARGILGEGFHAGCAVFRYNTLGLVFM